MSLEKKPICCILVHGTKLQAQAGEWTKHGSPIRRAIEDLSPNVQLEEFSWSGDPSQTARAKAAHALGEKLASLQHRYATTEERTGRH
jgi:hypothetical protein